MKRSAVLLILLLAGVVNAEVIHVWHAPDDDCEAAIVEQFGKAKHAIHYQMYNFTSKPVADALIAAHERGVDVLILLDHVASLSVHCQATRCAAAGVDVWIDWKHPIAHNKVRICDGKYTLGGSYNDSAQAHHNAENLTLDDSAAIAADFEKAFQEHLAHALTLKQSHAADLKHEREKQAKAKNKKRKA